MSYIYIYMELLVKPEMLTPYIYIYGPTFGNAETVSFYLLHNVSTLNQCREVSCVTFVCPYIYDVSISGFTRSSIYIYIYIYIYDISSLRVNRPASLPKQLQLPVPYPKFVYDVYAKHT